MIGGFRTFIDDDGYQRQSKDADDIGLNAEIRFRCHRCISPVSTVPHGGQIIVHSTNQQSTIQRSDRKLQRKGAELGVRHGPLYGLKQQVNLSRAKQQTSESSKRNV